MMSGIVTAILMVAFILMFFWAWSSDRKEEFDHLSQLPLEDNPLNNTEKNGDENGHV